MPAGPAEPGNADPLSRRKAARLRPDRLDASDDFVTRRDGRGGIGNSPSTTCRSVRQTPQASTRSSNSDGPGRGRRVPPERAAFPARARSSRASSPSRGSPRPAPPPRSSRAIALGGVRRRMGGRHLARQASGDLGEMIEAGLVKAVPTSPSAARRSDYPSRPRGSASPGGPSRPSRRAGQSRGFGRAGPRRCRWRATCSRWERTPSPPAPVRAAPTRLATAPRSCRRAPPCGRPCRTNRPNDRSRP